MYCHLTSFEMSSPNQVTSDVDERICKFILEVDDPDLITDLIRSYNGKVQNPEYDSAFNLITRRTDPQQTIHREV